MKDIQSFNLLKVNICKNTNRIYDKNMYKYLKNKSNIFFNVDFSDMELSLKVADRYIQDIQKIEKIIKRLKKQKEFSVILKVKRGKSKYEEFVIDSIKLISIDGKLKRYNFLYDSICSYLDNETIKNNVCGFENNKCIAKRNTTCTMGCCHHFENKYFGILYQRKMVLC